MSKWQPIETAPVRPFDKDHWYMAHSEHLLLWNGHWCEIGTYDFTERGKGRWLDKTHRILIPTHWMPLPEPPQ